MSTRHAITLALGLTLFAVGCDVQVSQTSGPSSEQKLVELTGSAGVDGKTWLVSFEQAKKKSAETGRPIAVDFTGSDWCGWCIKLDEEVFSKPEFEKWASEKVVLLKLDYPRGTKQDEALVKQNRTLMRTYGIEGFPTILFLDATGQVIGQSGYEPGGPANWTSLADQMLGSSS